MLVHNPSHHPGKQLLEPLVGNGNGSSRHCCRRELENTRPKSLQHDGRSNKGVGSNAGYGPIYAYIGCMATRSTGYVGWVSLSLHILNLNDSLYHGCCACV